MGFNFSGCTSKQHEVPATVPLEDSDAVAEAKSNQRTVNLAVKPASKRATLFQTVKLTDAPWKTKISGVSAYTKIVCKGIANDYCSRRENREKSQGWGKKSDQLYVKYGFNPNKDCWNRVRYSSPEAMMVLDTKTGQTPCINLSSYNYLGFGNHEVCRQETSAAIVEPGWSTPQTRTEGGSYDGLKKLEQEVATFMGKEDAIVVNQGFAANSSIVPALIDHNLNGDGVLVLSDQFNHHSVVEGLKFVGCTVCIFEHNDVVMLERLIQEQLRSDKVWRKIFIFIEGLYSMEGDFGLLPEIVAIKKRYGAYLYVDEAHSFGAIGKSGRGVCEHFNISPGDVDVLMGTFSKSLACAGGYVAADRATILSLRLNAPGSFYARPLSPPCVQQIRTALRELQTPDGLARLASLKRNANLFRNELQKEGFRVLGATDSPIVPLLIHHPNKLVKFSRRCLDQEISVVSVGYPAVPFLMERARFTLSSNLTEVMLMDSARKICKIARKAGLPRNVAEKKMPKVRVLGKGKEHHPDLQWQPEPMTTFSPELAALHQAVSVGASQAQCNLRGVDPFNFDGQPLQESIEAANQALQEYGFGACNPRAFYGTTPEHLQLETEIAGYCGFRASAVYSAGSVTASSAIKSLVQAGDEIVMSPSAHFGFVTGAHLTRAKVTFVDLEDMPALSSVLNSIHSRLPNGGRCFVLTESISEKTGRTCPTTHLISIKQEYGERVVLIVDESLTFACYDYDNKQQDFKQLRQAADVITCSMENALGGIGGFVTGRFDAVEHQRLFGSGYLYSAATPAPAIASLRAVLGSIGSDEFDEKRDALLSSAQKLHAGLRKLADRYEVKAISSQLSYVQHLAWLGSNPDEMLLKLSTDMQASGIAIQVVSPTLTRQESGIVTKMGGQPVEQASLRLCLNSDLSSKDIEQILCVLQSALQHHSVDRKVGVQASPIPVNASCP